jgi:hypothetical protein
MSSLQQLQLLMERVTIECGVQPTVMPEQSQDLQDALVASVWAHDRLFDMVNHRALLVSHVQSTGRLCSG